MSRAKFMLRRNWRKLCHSLSVFPPSLDYFQPSSLTHLMTTTFNPFSLSHLKTTRHFALPEFLPNDASRADCRIVLESCKNTLYFVGAAVSLSSIRVPSVLSAFLSSFLLNLRMSWTWSHLTNAHCIFQHQLYRFRSNRR